MLRQNCKHALNIGRVPSNVPKTGNVENGLYFSWMAPGYRPETDDKLYQLDFNSKQEIIFYQ